MQKILYFPKAETLSSNMLFSIPRNYVTSPSHHYKVNLPLIFFFLPEVVLYPLYFISNFLFMVHLQNGWVSSWTWMRYVLLDIKSVSLTFITPCSTFSDAIFAPKIITHIFHSHRMAEFRWSLKKMYLWSATFFQYVL